MNYECRINSCNLAILVNKNPYGNIKELTLNYWKKINPEEFKKFNISVESDIEKIKKISKKHKINIKKEFKDCINSDDILIMKNNREEVFKKISLIKNKEDKEELQKTFTSLTNKNFGVKKESSVIDKYSNILNKKINTKSNLYKKNIIKYNTINWVLVGKIDGMVEDNIIIEIKNRIHRLFYSLKEYEKVQIMSYLYLINLNEAHLVESYKDDINSIIINYDDDYWINEVLTPLYKYIYFFDTFLNSDKLKYDVINNNNNYIYELLY